jgi:hypothetical protein
LSKNYEKTPFLNALELVITGVPHHTCGVIYRSLDIGGLEKSSTVQDLKTKIFEKSGLAIERQQLYFSGKEYEDSQALEGIPNLDDWNRVVLQLKPANK